MAARKTDCALCRQFIHRNLINNSSGTPKIHYRCSGTKKLPLKINQATSRPIKFRLLSLLQQCGPCMCVCVCVFAGGGESDRISRYSLLWIQNILCIKCKYNALVVNGLHVLHIFLEPLIYIFDRGYYGLKTLQK